MDRLSCLRDERGCRLLFLLVLFSAAWCFAPIEPYLVPCLVRQKHFTNFQVINVIFPISIYSTLVFTFLAAPACNIFSYWAVILIGGIMKLVTFSIIRYGSTLLLMQIMQVTYGLYLSSNVVFSSYLFLLVVEDKFHQLTSIQQGTIAASFVLASELGQLLVIKGFSFTLLLDVTIISIILSLLVLLFLPKDQPRKKERSLSLLNVFSFQQDGIWHAIKDTWQAPSLQLLSMWWALAYGGFSLISNYATNLFEGVSSTSNYNGHVIAIGMSFQCLSSFCAIYFANIVNNTGGLLYAIGSGFVGIVCIVMGNCKSLWIIYALFMIIPAVRGLLLCVLYAQCGSLLPNQQYILFFSFNTALGLLVETMFQVMLEIIGFDIFKEFMAFGIYFLGFTALFVLLYGAYIWRTGTWKFSLLDGSSVSDVTLSSRLLNSDE